MTACECHIMDPRTREKRCVRPSGVASLTCDKATTQRTGRVCVPPKGHDDPDNQMRMVAPSQGHHLSFEVVGTSTTPMYCKRAQLIPSRCRWSVRVGRSSWLRSGNRLPRIVVSSSWLRPGNRLPLGEVVLVEPSNRLPEKVRSSWRSHAIAYLDVARHC